MKRILLVLLVILGPISVILAQVNEPIDGPRQAQGPPGGPQQFPNHGGPMIFRTNPEIRRQLEEIKIWQMTKEMNLPTDKSEEFFPLYNKYNEEMRRTTTERQESVRKLDSMVNHGGSEPEMRGQIANVVALDSRLAGIHLKFIQSLGKILTPTEVAKYIVFEQRFDREIRNRIRILMRQRMMGHGR